jgi:phage tail-like protein
MDVNGTRFHLLLGCGDWARCRTDDDRPLGELWATGEHTDVRYDPDRDELTLAALPFQFRAAGAAPPLDVNARRGAARDRYGNWYWIDTVPTTILVNSSGSGATAPFWGVADATAVRRRPVEREFQALAPRPPQPPLRLAGAAVTTDHYLVVGVTQPPGLLVFDLYGGGPPEQIRWPVPFVPFDMAARPAGGVYVLDREHGCYWELDSHLLVVAHGGDGPAPARPFQPLTGEPAGPSVRVCFRPPSERDAVPLDTAEPGGPPDPVAIEATPDGTVLVLFHHPAGGPSTVRPYRDGAPFGSAAITADPAIGLSVTGHDIAFVPPAEPPAGSPAAKARLGSIFVVDGRGDQTYEFSVDAGDGGLRLSAVERYYPMRLFGGKGLVTAERQPYYDVGDNWFPLVEQQLRRYRSAGVVLTDLLDGQQDGCVWHRVLIDACLPSAETTVEVCSAASDDPEPLRDYPPWFAEPAPYPRGDGSEQPFAPVDPSGAYRTWELLLQQARGRYLRLKLGLAGNERATPRIRAVRVHYPRFSYLDRYLPAVYREDQMSASFLDRFLANVEGIATTVEGRIAAAQILFDPSAAPADSLDWLASWFDLILDPAWDEAKRRLLLTHAMDFLRWRGTVRGLQTALALALDDAPEANLFADRPPACARRARIVERYQTRVTPPVVLGDPTGAGKDGNDDGNDDGGSVPASGADVQVLWQDFLTRRYQQRFDALRTAYQLGPAVSGFDGIPLPATAPGTEPARADWLHFQTVVLPSYRTAHRFRVLLPVSARTRIGQPDGDPLDPATRLRLARRIVELEKPAHTVFDVKFYWEAFRVGEARLGLDTLVDLGGRSPSLLEGAVLGRTYLGESFLAGLSTADRSRDRRVFHG